MCLFETKPYRNEYPEWWCLAVSVQLPLCIVRPLLQDLACWLILLLLPLYSYWRYWKEGGRGFGLMQRYRHRESLLNKPYWNEWWAPMAPFGSGNPFVSWPVPFWHKRGGHMTLLQCSLFLILMAGIIPASSNTSLELVPFYYFIACLSFSDFCHQNPFASWLVGTNLLSLCATRTHVPVAQCSLQWSQSATHHSTQLDHSCKQ